ncbi:MAG: c-type cytochrome [Proteobacteria bacterium]|jgi:cytochrome c oxidase cbb3-type subunit 3|nr:c-type cytochrome [Pseudomonadota bacterium]
MSEEKKDQVRPATYDGIQEYDNQLPKWWVFTFILSVIFAFIYWSRYYVFESAPNQATELSQKMSEVNKIQGKSAPTESADFAALSKDLKAIEQGGSVFKTNCVACHGQLGEGGIGPNLTDKYWLHGHQPEQIEQTIIKGVIEKGMTPWKGILSASQIRQVTVYVMSLEGSNPPNAKAAQGEAVEK